MQTGRQPLRFSPQILSKVGAVWRSLVLTSLFSHKMEVCPRLWSGLSLATLQPNYEPHKGNLDGQPCSVSVAFHVSHICITNYYARTTGKVVAGTKTQPWKAFWPMKAENYPAEHLKAMPWLTWKPDANKPDDKPWRRWMLDNQSMVLRRGASSGGGSPRPDPDPDPGSGDGDGLRAGKP
jgi:hypothetical protein